MHGWPVTRAGRVVLAVSLAGLAGCADHADARHVTLTVTPAASRVDRPVRLAIRGLPAHGRAVLRASWRSHDGVLWASSVPLRADADGSTALAGMHWAEAMRPHGRGFFFPSVARPNAIRLAVVEDGRVVARGAVSRRLAPASLHVRRLTVKRDGLWGRYYAPPTRTRRPSLLVIGGGEGGVPDGGAALLASDGYPALALGYFSGPGVPRRLERIPLEYFARGLRWLARRPGVDPRRVVVYGVSRGGEGALLIGATFPRLVRGVIAMVPNYETYPAPFQENTPSWTHRGKGIAPYSIIPVERINGPILAAGAGEDARWPSSGATHQIELRLRESHFRFAHRRLDFPHAGHDVGVAGPYLPQSIDRDYWGGTRAATAAGRVVIWKAVLAYLRRL